MRRNTTVFPRGSPLVAESRKCEKKKTPGSRPRWKEPRVNHGNKQKQLSSLPLDTSPGIYRLGGRKQQRGSARAGGGSSPRASKIKNRTALRDNSRIPAVERGNKKMNCFFWFGSGEGTGGCPLSRGTFLSTGGALTKKKTKKMQEGENSNS